jgi:hypothetical protein
MNEKLKRYRISTNKYHLWKYEVSEEVLNDKSLPDFISEIDNYPIENLISGKVYHNKRKKLISITVKPIKTTFILPYCRQAQEKTQLFPSYKEKELSYERL